MKAILGFPAVIALSIGLLACGPKNVAVTPPTTGVNPQPSALVMTLDGVYIAAGTASTFFQGKTGEWLSAVQPTVLEISSDLQQTNPFAQALAIDQTLRNVLTQEQAAKDTFSPQQLQVANAVTKALGDFLTIYEMQAGITTTTTISAKAKRTGKLMLNDADIAKLKGIRTQQ